MLKILGVTRVSRWSQYNLNLDIELVRRLLRHAVTIQQLYVAAHSLQACVLPRRMTAGRTRAGEPAAVADGAASDRAGHAAPVAAARPPGPLPGAPKHPSRMFCSGMVVSTMRVMVRRVVRHISGRDVT